VNWSEPVDAYCERLQQAFWAEPLNAVTNIGFVVAALYGFLIWRRGPGSDVGVFLLSLLALCVGAGSFLFHTLATRGAALADVIPIGLFIILGFVLVLRRLIGLGWIAAIAATMVFLAASPDIAERAAPLFGSSAAYIPPLAALLGIGAGLALFGVPAGGAILIAGLVFLVSLIARMADHPLCETIPIGTHFVWHLLNAAVLALVIRAVARPQPPPKAPAPAT
jgi:hypothetical protein